MDDDGNGKIDDIRGWDFIGDGNSPEDNNPEDYNGHGTFIAGLIAAEHDGAGMVGFVKLRRFYLSELGSWDNLQYIEARSMRFQEEEKSELEFWWI